MQIPEGIGVPWYSKVHKVRDKQISLGENSTHTLVVIRLQCLPLEEASQ